MKLSNGSVSTLLIAALLLVLASLTVVADGLPDTNPVVLKAVDGKRRPPAAKEDSARGRRRRSASLLPTTSPTILPDSSGGEGLLTAKLLCKKGHLSIHRLHALDAHGRRYRAAARDEAEMRLQSHKELAQGQYLLNPTGSNVSGYC